MICLMLLISALLVICDALASRTFSSLPLRGRLSACDVLLCHLNHATYTGRKKSHSTALTPVICSSGTSTSCHHRHGAASMLAKMSKHQQEEV